MQKTLNEIPVAQRVVQKIITGLANKNYDSLSGNCGLTREDVNYMRDSIENYGMTMTEIPIEHLEKSEGVFVERRSDNKIKCWHFDVDLWTQEEGRSDLSLTTYIYIEGDKAWLDFQDLHVL